MKGVVLGICPDAQLLDITHLVPPQDVVRAMLILDDAYRYFAPGTVFLCVVDPGVGSERRGVAVEADGYRFVGPDNGLFSRVVARAPDAKFIELTSATHARPQISRTFEGRDRFAPAAAWLARGVPVESLGDPVGSLVVRQLPDARLTNDAIDGEVLAVDHFGNLITNIEGTWLARLGGRVEVFVDGQSVPPLVQTYAEVPIGGICALIGSGDRLEIAVRNGSAAAILGLTCGAAVRVCTRA